ncbi:DUF4149 domain-containing protein [Granulicella sp. S190]|uniref:DUF4149 domain-containing protein n=1 Tax=Granulicella sp. S190 TaxID=1747226 RepID=UPI00352B715C
MVIWVGGLGFFAFVMAPVAFHSLPSAHDAGIMIGGTLRILHWIGLVGGAVFYLATGLLWLRARVTARAEYAIEMILVGLMMAGTFYSQFRILPAMDADRALACGSVEIASADNNERIAFERLHALSEKVEEFVLVCGLGLVFVMSRES